MRGQRGGVHRGEGWIEMEVGRDAERADGWKPAVSHILACRVQTQSLLPLILVHLLGEHHVVLFRAWCDWGIIISSGPYPCLLQAVFFSGLVTESFIAGYIFLCTSMSYFYISMSNHRAFQLIFRQVKSTLSILSVSVHYCTHYVFALSSL